eukprot:scaffold259062_cov22-Prasinocladus_malaysianus.AAC.1
MREAGMHWPDDRETIPRALDALRHVWASKFNDRAYYSMRKVSHPGFAGSAGGLGHYMLLTRLQTHFACANMMPYIVYIRTEDTH